MRQRFIEFVGAPLAEDRFDEARKLCAQVRLGHRIRGMAQHVFRFGMEMFTAFQRYIEISLLLRLIGDRQHLDSWHNRLNALIAQRGVVEIGGHTAIAAQTHGDAERHAELAFKGRLWLQLASDEGSVGMDLHRYSLDGTIADAIFQRLSRLDRWMGRATASERL